MSRGTVLHERPSSGTPARPSDGGDHGEAIKLVSCIIRPERLDAVKDAVQRLEITHGMTVSDVRGFGRQKGQVEHYRGGEYTIRFVPKVRIDIAVSAGDVDRLMTAVADAARTGQVGDGKIFVTKVGHAVRFRTGERGLVAI